MTGLVLVVALVLRWVARGLLRVADWVDPEPELSWFVLDEDQWGESDAEIVPLYGRSRRG